MDKKYQTSLELRQNVKRYLITMLCTVPLLILVGIFLEGKVSKGLRIFVFVLILTGAFLIEEFIYSKIKFRQKDKPAVKHKDVFK